MDALEDDAAPVAPPAASEDAAKLDMLLLEDDAEDDADEDDNDGDVAVAVEVVADVFWGSRLLAVAAVVVVATGRVRCWPAADGMTLLFLDWGWGGLRISMRTNSASLNL